MQRTVAREIRTRSVGRLAEVETSRCLQDILETKGLSDAERNEYVKRLEDFSSFVTDALLAVPQLEQQEKGDEEVRAVPESETVPTGRVERPDKRRKEQSTRAEIVGDSPRAGVDYFTFEHVCLDTPHESALCTLQW